MQFKYLSLVVLMTTFASTFADVSITSPIAGTQWKAGKKVSITWLEVPKTETPANIDIYLVAGQAENLKIVGTIANGVDSTKKKYTWTVPKDLVNNMDYSVRIDAGDNQSYSHYFHIDSEVMAPKTTSKAVPTSTQLPPSSSTSIPTAVVAASDSKNGAASFTFGSLLMVPVLAAVLN
ncbi:hypothetical protein K7432_010356 [Basidiobolus ranarum]|uniref:Yeast cell wall synthesis Kre9/Knh1-like N-terminal domain-containing protein n=1 Tax=Basidiobolus ranarum TaxID=34480 RepID=A0ABR2WNT7_9FUNG